MRQLWRAMPTRYQTARWYDDESQGGRFVCTGCSETPVINNYCSTAAVFNDQSAQRKARSSELEYDNRAKEGVCALHFMRISYRLAVIKGSMPLGRWSIQRKSPARLEWPGKVDNYLMEGRRPRQGDLTIADGASGGRVSDCQPSAGVDFAAAAKPPPVDAVRTSVAFK
jgi:hypothetical protein